MSLVGDRMGDVALVVHVQQRRGTGVAVGMLLLVAALPRVASPLAGVVADRVPRRALLVAGELAQAAVVAVIVVWLPSLPVLLVLLLAKHTVATVAEPAARSAVPALVDDADLPRANALLGGARELGEVAGPLLGGVVAATVGVRAVLALDALSFVAAVPLLRTLPALERSPRLAAGTSVRRDALDGVRYLLRAPVPRALAAVFLLVGLSAADDVALPFLAVSFGSGPIGVGLLYAAVGGGLLLGYALLARRPLPLPAAGAFLAGVAVAATGDVLAGLAPVLAAAVAAQLVRGVGIALLETHLQTVLQRTVPDALLGRVFANVYGAVNLAAAGALVAGGWLLDATSARLVLVVSGATGLAAAGLGLVLLRPRGEDAARVVGTGDG